MLNNCYYYYLSHVNSIVDDYVSSSFVLRVLHRFDFDFCKIGPEPGVTKCQVLLNISLGQAEAKAEAKAGAMVLAQERTHMPALPYHCRGEVLDSSARRSASLRRSRMPLRAGEALSVWRFFQ